MTNAVAINCTDDVVSKVESVTGLKGRVFTVFSEEELIERTKGLGFPCVGVVYDGMRAISEPGSTHKIGGSAELVISVIVFFKQETRAQRDVKAEALQYLDSIRSTLLKSKAPSGHFWKFQVEASIDGKTGVLAYLQRWAAPVQLV